jgi:outer membrane protein TolC
MHKFSLFFIFGTLAVNSAVFAQPVTLDAYLQQVEGTSPAVHSSELNVEGSLHTAKEADLPLIPKLIFNASHELDNRTPVNPFVGSHTTQDNLGVGLSEQFEFGLNATVSYGLVNNYSDGINPLFYPPNGILQYSQGQTEIDLSQPLWRNFLGAEIKATEARDRATSLSTHYSESFKLKQLRAQAESAYFRLAVARESIKLEREVLDHSQKILDWTSKRVRNQLADKSDMLQAKATLQSRQLDLQSSIDEERSARLAFNSFRNSTDDAVPEELTAVSSDDILILNDPTRADVSDDVKAAEESEKLAVANNELSRQKALPDFSIYATAAYNGVNQYLSPAVGASFTTDHPMYLVGVKFSMPIYFWETSEIRAGRVKQQLGAEAAILQTKLTNDQSWIDWSRKLAEAKARLKMADELVSAQKEKSDYERYRFNLGRTTTYQVLTFEQDYAQALIDRLRIEHEILDIHSQMKTLAAN